ncbi:DUF4259 domain-containing protein [Streptomyces sp. endophyte_N2]|uniref:DUF4259 domain-containing protein n=1 Tax=Streptomyces murinus TaxID=33900 RepID=UPI0013E8B9C6
MGTRDIGLFGNDTAADFAGDLDEAAAAQRVPMIRRVLERAAAGAELLEIPDAERAVAARHPAGGPEHRAGGGPWVRATARRSRCLNSPRISGRSPSRPWAR